MNQQPNPKSLTFDENTAFIVLGAMCLMHAAIWFWLRDPSSSADPYVGAEGLAIFALFFLGLGAFRRRGERNAA